MARARWRRGCGTALACLAVALVFLAAIGSSQVAASKVGADKPVIAKLSANLGHGYSLQLQSAGRHIVLSLNHDLFAGVQYEFHGRVSARGIRARIGNRGVIELEFNPSGKSAQVSPPSSCTGSRSLATEGTFLGSLRMRREPGLPAEPGNRPQMDLPGQVLLLRQCAL